ncbi:MAG: hypothetical protein H0W73_13315 [Bacteroidetes bacterium]|nr:hypothetical protein [Bacteroidota bacterium]
MKTIKTSLISLCFFALSTGVYSQVKIGDNPNTINANSLLELESSNKGFLPPRVALNYADSIVPLTAGTPSGMTVYSSGGTLPNGHYTWNGSKWLLFNTTNTAKNNYVLVKSASDFPQPVSGVITLSTNTLYEVNGTIILTSKIKLNGATISGQNRSNDILLYTPSTGELFTGILGGHISNITAIASNPGAKVFNIDAGNNAASSLIVEFVYIFNSDNVGLVKGFAGFVVFSNVAYSNNTNGITFENVGDYVELNNFWIADNKNIFTKLVGTFSTILIEGGKKHALSFFSAKGLDVSGITSVTTGAELKNTLFVGDGIKVVGSFSKQWEVEATGVNVEKDAIATGNLYVSSVIVTTFPAINTSTKILGTTTTASLFRVTSPSDNRLTYNGTKAKRFQVICSLSAIASGNNKNFSFYIAKNGVVLPESKQLMKCSSSVDRGSITLSCTVLLSPNDYIEVWAENNSDATSLTIESLNLAIK